jgi:uncharacterized damage-inducible protein DinB
MKLTEFLLAEMDREVERSRRALEQVPEGKYDWKPHEKSMIFGYLAKMIQDTINHWTHHRGQMTVYLRLMGAKVPALYGPSADDNSFQ